MRLADCLTDKQVFQGLEQLQCIGVLEVNLADWSPVGLGGWDQDLWDKLEAAVTDSLAPL